MSAQPTFEAVIDEERNLVRTWFSGKMTSAEMKAAADTVEQLAPRLKPNFKIFGDFSRIESMDPDCVPHLARIMDICRDRGAGLIVRLLPEASKDIGINLLSVIHYRGKVRIVTADTPAGAERALLS